MRSFRVVRKICLLVPILVSYFVVAIFGLILSCLSTAAAIRFVLTPSIRLHCRLIFAVLGVRIAEVNPGLKREVGKGALVISNHRTYLDMMVMHTRVDGCFITSEEVRKDPIFGLFAKTSGCIFVDRESRANQAEEIAKIREYHRQGINVIFFPEAKATGGEMLRFRRPFFAPAMELERKILAVTVNYTAIDGRALDRETKDDIYWYRQNRILDHLAKLLSFKRVDVECVYHLVDTRQARAEEHIAETCFKIIAKDYRQLV